MSESTLAATVALNTGEPSPALSATSDGPDYSAAQTTTTETVETAPAKTEDTAAKTEETPAADTPAKPDAAAKKADETPAWMKAEITKERNKTRAAEEARTAAEAKANAADKLAREALEAVKALKPKEVDPSDVPRPDRTKFDTPDEYDAALMKWTEDRTAATVRADEARKAEERESAEKSAAETARQTAAAEETLKTWSDRVTKTVETLPDFEEVVYKDVKDGGPNITTVMRDAILTLEDGPKLAYHLGKNPAEAMRISGLAPLAQVLEIGRLAYEVSRPVLNLSKAPDPITPTAGRQAAEPKSDNELSGDEYYAKYAEARRVASRSH